MERHRLTGGVLATVGLVLATIQVAHALQQTDVPVAVAVDAVPFVAMGLGVAFVGVWLVREPAVADHATRVALWSVGGMVALASVSALVLFSQEVTTGTLARASYLTIDLVTVGALGGALVGLYDVRSRRHRASLEREHDRIEAFAEKAADVNNYGRAIYGARSVDGVAAYAVEATEALVGLGETALLRVGEGEATVLASTVRRVDEDELDHLADVASEGEARDVVVHEAADVGDPADVARVVTALVHEGEEGATVLVAVSADPDPVPEEDRQLLELVVSHAAATLARLESEAAD